MADRTALSGLTTCRPQGPKQARAHVGEFDHVGDSLMDDEIARYLEHRGKMRAARL
jgi:hypothetical protein